MKTKTISLLLVMAVCLLLFAGCQDAKLHSYTEDLLAEQGDEVIEETPPLRSLRHRRIILLPTTIFRLSRSYSPLTALTSLGASCFIGISTMSATLKAISARLPTGMPTALSIRRKPTANM